MKLSIITINYNNAEGLRKTLASVASQTYADIEHVIVDGGSTDGSVEVIREYEQSLASRLSPLASNLKWISEPDKGIYNAMNKGIEIALGRRIVNALNRSELVEDKNKGIRMATGEYCQFLNSGDLLLNPHVTQQMIEHLDQINAQREEPIGVMYGNMKKVMPDGKILHDACNGGHDVTLNMFYCGCLNHSPAYILRALFDKYGMYDESLRICSDWKFYLQSLVLGDESIAYVNVDVTLFDMTGISETNKDLLNSERNRLLEELIPAGILKDYDEFHFPMIQYRRLKKYHLWGLVYFIERVLFKLEKWHILK